MISCSSKKFQYLLALISSVLFSMHLFRISPKEDILPTGENTVLIIIMYFFILPGLLWITFIWNRWLYENMFEVDSNSPISYEGFQCIATVVLFILAIYFIVRTFIFPVN